MALAAQALSEARFKTIWGDQVLAFDGVSESGWACDGCGKFERGDQFSWAAARRRGREHAQHCEGPRGQEFLPGMHPAGF